MRLGGMDIVLKNDSLVYELYRGSRLLDGRGMIRERFRHRYELNPDYRKMLEDGGLVFSGWAPNQLIMQVLELPAHPFFIGVQYHPEFTSRPMYPNPLFFGFVKACMESQVTSR